MTEEELRRLIKLNGTKTARAIVRAYYPPSARMNFNTDDLTPEFRQAIRGKFLLIILRSKYIFILDYVNIFHEMECLTDGKINESINNVFRSAKSQEKERNTKNQPEQAVANNSKMVKSQKQHVPSGKENVIPKKH